MELKTRVEHYATTWTYNLKWEHKPQTKDSTSQTWETTKQSSDTLGLQPSNPCGLEKRMDQHLTTPVTGIYSDMLDS